MSEKPATWDEVPPFDPDPELVDDIEGNRFAVRAFRKAAQQAHEQAMEERRRAEAVGE